MVNERFVEAELLLAQVLDDLLEQFDRLLELTNLGMQNTLGRRADEGRIALRLGRSEEMYRASSATGAQFPHEFELIYRLGLDGAPLRLEWSVRNTGTDAAPARASPLFSGAPR